MSALKAFRRQSRILLVEIARESKIDLSKLSKIENGWTPIRPKDAERISRAYRKFNLNVDEILEQMMSA